MFHISFLVSDLHFFRAPVFAKFVVAFGTAVDDPVSGTEGCAAMLLAFCGFHAHWGQFLSLYRQRRRKPDDFDQNVIDVAPAQKCVCIWFGAVIILNEVSTP